jgi:hypothetical protein
MTTNQDPGYRCPECDTYSGTFIPQPDMQMLHSICGREGSINSFIRGTDEYERAYEGADELDCCCPGDAVDPFCPVHREARQDAEDAVDSYVEPHWGDPGQGADEDEGISLRDLRFALADFEQDHKATLDEDDQVAFARVRLLLLAAEEQS